MTLSELQPWQLEQLKQTYLVEHNLPAGTSYAELAEANELVSFENLEKEYGDIDFVEDDFYLPF